MTEYDFSPGAVRAHMEKLQKIERWTLQVNPLTVRDAHTPATPAPDTFSSLPRDGSSKPYRPRHSREPSYDRDRAGEGGYGYDKRERWRDRERSDSRRDRDMDRSFDDEDYDPYTNARPHRSKSNAITPSQPKHPPPAARAYTMPPKPTNTRRTSHDIYQHGSGSAGLDASKSQPQVYRGSSHDLNNQNRPSSSHQGSKYNLPATAPATTSRRHNPRSASTNDVTSGKYSSGAAVYDQNKPHPSRSSFDHPRSAQAAPPSYGAPANGHAAQPASATLPRSAKPPHSRMPSSTALNPYPYGQYPSQTQLPMQQSQQKSQIYLPQRSQAHLPPPSQPQPQPQPTSHPPPAPSTATRKPPPAPLNLPPHPNAALPALKGGSYSAQVYQLSKTTAAKSAGYYPPAAGPYHVALPPGFQPQSGPAAPIPISPPHNRLAFQQTPSPLPTYSGPMPQLKEKPRPLIKRLLGSLTGSKASLSTTSFTPTTTTTTAGNTTPGTEYTVPMSATQTRGVPLDSGVRPVSAPPMKSSRSRDRDRDREWEHAREYERERERASDRDRERERSRTAGGEKGGARWYDMEVDQQEWELVTKDDRDVYERVKRVEGGGKMQQQQQVHTHTRTPTHTLKKRREGGYDRRLSH